MKPTRPRYTLEFKQEAVLLVESGQNLVAASRIFGPSRADVVQLGQDPSRRQAAACPSRPRGTATLVAFVIDINAAASWFTISNPGSVALNAARLLRALRDSISPRAATDQRWIALPCQHILLLIE